MIYKKVWVLLHNRSNSRNPSCRTRAHKKHLQNMRSFLSWFRASRNQRALKRSISLSGITLCTSCSHSRVSKSTRGRLNLWTLKLCWLYKKILHMIPNLNRMMGLIAPDRSTWSIINNQSHSSNCSRNGKAERSHQNSRKSHLWLICSFLDF